MSKYKYKGRANGSPLTIERVTKLLNDKYLKNETEKIQKKNIQRKEKK